MLLAAIYSYLCGYECGGVAAVDVYVLLGVTVGEGKPGALYLYHDTVSLFKGMGHIVHCIFYFGELAGLERFRVLVTVAVAAAHNIATHQHLVAAHRVGYAVAGAVGGSVVRKIIGEYIYQLYHKISIGSGYGGKKVSYDRAREGYICGQAVGLVHEYVRAAGGKALVVVHILSCTVKVNTFGIGHRL